MLNSAVGECLVLSFAFLQIFELFECYFSSLLLISLILVFAHIQRLVVPAGEFLLCLEPIFDGLVDAGAAGCSLYVDCIQIALVGFIESDAIFEGVAFWRLEDAFGCNF